MAGRGRCPKRLKAAAYRYAEGDGPIPRELVTLGYIDRFGAQNVFGRILGYGEIQRFVTVENIVSAYRERERAESWAAWAREHEYKHALLNEAMKAAMNGESTD